VEIKKLWLFL